MVQAEREQYLREARQRIVDAPIYDFLGMEVVEMRDGHSLIRLPANRNLMQLYNNVHGGIIATLADSAVGTALISLINHGERTLTVELKVNYIAPFATGALLARGRIVHRGYRIAFGEATLHDDKGTLIATASATYVVKREKAAPHSEPPAQNGGAQEDEQHAHHNQRRPWTD